MRLIGPAGALVGVLMGELVNVSGLVILSFHEIRKPQPALNVPASAKT
jgi:hypothetical protein